MIRNLLDSYSHLGEYIISCQEKNGAIAWEPRSKVDPWDHVEAAMGLSIAGKKEEAKSTDIDDVAASDGSTVDPAELTNSMAAYSAAISKTKDIKLSK